MWITNIAEVMILNFKSCESLLFSNLFQRDCPFVLLEDKQNGKSGGVDRPWILPTLAMVYKCFDIFLLLYRVYLEYLQVQGRFGGMW